jgi:uncharacterized heparinase superfamily protein
MLTADRFRFLNREGQIGQAADWNDPGTPKLWLYHLHYFDDLTAEGWKGRGEWHHRLLRRWIEENPPGTGNGWEPYPVSLRSVNWIKWALAGNSLPPESVTSLAAQIRQLSRRPEYHLMGNHLWANGKALVFAGLFFKGAEADAWRKQGEKILRRELDEQVLPDGGHFERSPMYHALFLEDLLDLVNLRAAYRCEDKDDKDENQDNQEPRQAIAAISAISAISLMRTWLEVMSHPDGKTALFNDAAFSVAPLWKELDDYALRLGFGEKTSALTELIRFPETGYIRCDKGPAVLFIDAAPIGPDYIPGHAHADTLNFELSLYGRRVIVDTGTSTYDATPERRRQRGTAAHNTVGIDGEDSSEVWNGFRVARRARPFDLEISRTAGAMIISCAHDGYRRLPGKPVHRRRWQLSEDGLTVHDHVEGGFNEAVARYHFHPEVYVTLSSEHGGKVHLPGGEALDFTISRGIPQLTESTYHPEFNVSQPCGCLEIVLAGGKAEICFAWN